MRVDTDGLRRSAERLDEEVVQALIQVQGWMTYFPGNGERALGGPEGGAAHRVAVEAWSAELDNLQAALQELTTALRAAADGYDRSDAAAAGRLGAVR
jgi:hypothetical protein